MSKSFAIVAVGCLAALLAAAVSPAAEPGADNGWGWKCIDLRRAPERSQAWK